MIQISASPSVQKILNELNGSELLIRLDWDEWQEVNAPYNEVVYNQVDVFTRFNRNGYDWDIQGILYTPAEEVDANIAIVMFHGGAGSSYGKDKTPDGRPGLPRVLAAQGFKVLNLTYPGHYPPGGIWKESVEERQPWYLLDQKLSDQEIYDRNLKCTFNVILQGSAQLVDEHLKGRKILAHGHSTGGPMAAHLYRFTKQSEVIGILGWGSGGPDGWRKEWRDKTGAEGDGRKGVDEMSKRSVQAFAKAGYVSDPELCPWGGAEGFVKWAEPVRSQMKTGLCDNQHMVVPEVLERYPTITGLPREEYFDHLQDPDPEWLKSIKVILMVGGDDKGHWVAGKREKDKREIFMGRKYEAAGTRVHVVFVPKYGHYGMMEKHNEKIAYSWLWAFKGGYFSS
ncbi:MAG: alpha/beta fold hydrolase [Pseudomonadota bacterium]|nr:alpha/beta fold hydrolase [Pseudomonadota bacterium]